MSSRKNTKFNKNNGYKDFSFSIPKQNDKVYREIINTEENNYLENSLKSSIDIPKK